VGNSSALGTGTVTLHGNTEFSPSASVTIANPIVLVGDGALVDNEDGGSNNMTLTGLISGIGGFDWCAPGTLTLSNSTSTFSGGVEMREGTLYVGGNSSGGVNNAVTSGPLGIGDVDLEDSTVLAASTASAFIGNFIFLDDGRVQFGDNDNHSLTLAGTISGFGEVTFRGGPVARSFFPATMTLAGVSWWSRAPCCWAARPFFIRPWRLPGVYQQSSRRWQQPPEAP